MSNERSLFQRLPWAHLTPAILAAAEASGGFDEVYKEAAAHLKCDVMDIATLGSEDPSREGCENPFIVWNEIFDVPLDDVSLEWRHAKIENSPVFFYSDGHSGIVVAFTLKSAVQTEEYKG